MYSNLLCVMYSMQSDQEILLGSQELPDAKDLDIIQEPHLDSHPETAAVESSTRTYYMLLYNITVQRDLSNIF